MNTNTNYNFATIENAVEIANCSSSTKGCAAKHILDSNPKNLWLSKSGLPQHLTISLVNAINLPKTIK